jgi:hypothetical protein
MKPQTPPTAPAEPKPKPQENPAIHIDNTLHKAPKNPMTGRELKQLGSVAANYDLWKKVPGKDDFRIGDGDVIDLKPGDHFYSAPGSLNPGGA